MKIVPARGSGVGSDLALFVGIIATIGTCILAGLLSKKLPSVAAQLIECLTKTRGENPLVRLNHFSIVTISSKQLLGSLNDGLVYIERIAHVVHLHKGILLLPILVADASLLLTLAELRDIHLCVGVGIAQDILHTTGTTVRAVAAHSSPRRKSHTAESSGHIVRIREEGVRSITVMIPILLSLELAVGRSLVHEGFRGHGPAMGADQIAILPIHDEIALVVVATNFALMEL